MREANSTRAEQLGWEVQLSEAVDRRIDEYLAGKPREVGMLVSPSLIAPDPGYGRRTSIGITAFALPDSTFHSELRDDLPLSYIIYTKTLPKPVHAVSRSGQVIMSETGPATGGTRYEAFDEFDGPHLYKIGEDDQLHLVDPGEGKHLLWQVTNGVSARR